MFVAKYNASGNDFVIFHDFIKRDRSALAKALCHRQEGIGADGLIVCVPHETYDFEWQFYNDDGSSAEMCGNGSRACAHYAATHGLAGKEMTFLTLAGPIHAMVEGDIVQSELTPPVIIHESIEAYGYRWWLINTGVPHLVTFDAPMETFDLKMASQLRHEHNANVNIAKVHANHIAVRTFERGVENETLACGTGMAASYYRALKEGAVLATATTVIPTGGASLTLAYNGKTITFKGRVDHIFSAQFNV